MDRKVRVRRALLAAAIVAAAVASVAAGSRLATAASLQRPAVVAGQGETVVLLHGLWRSGRAWWLLERRLEAAGYATHAISYESTDLPLVELAARLDDQLRACCPKQKLHFVTHSLGGILLRAWVSERAPDPERIGRVVMLSPPNHGTQLVDFLGSARSLLGPSGSELGTDPHSAPSRLNSLGPVDFELGIIAGVRSFRWLTSWILDGPDDGTVSVASTRLAGMRDFLVVRSSHSRMIYDSSVAEQTLHFLGNGRFDVALDAAAMPALELGR